MGNPRRKTFIHSIKRKNEMKQIKVVDYMVLNNMEELSESELFDYGKEGWILQTVIPTEDWSTHYNYIFVKLSL